MSAQFVLLWQINAPYFLHYRSNNPIAKLKVVALPQTNSKIQQSKPPIMHIYNQVMIPDIPFTLANSLHH